MKKILFAMISFFSVFMFVSNSLAGNTTFDFEDLDLSNWALAENKSSVAYQGIIPGSLNGSGSSLLEVEITNPSGEPSSEWMASYYAPSQSWSNYNVSFDFEIFTSYCCNWHYMDFYFYSQSMNLSDNAYQIRISNQNNTIVLSKYVYGVGTELASAFNSFSMYSIYHIDVEAKEGQIKVYVGGTLLIDVLDSTFSSGAFGLGVSNAGSDNNKVHFDNVVVDTMDNPPVANNAPVANADSILIHEENEDCLIVIDATAIDPDDNLESVIAYIELPSLEGLDIKLKENHKTKVKFNLEEEKVNIKSPDPRALLEEIVKYGGFAVRHGQNIWIRTSDDYSKYEFNLKKGDLQIKAPEVTLYVTATDSDGLSDTAKAGPLCSHENDDVDDDDDDDHHRGHMSYKKRHHEYDDDDDNHHHRRHMSYKKRRHE